MTSLLDTCDNILDFGGYVGSNLIGTTGSIQAGQAVLTLVASQDWQNGHGIVVYGAGPEPTLATPTGIQVSSQGVLNGTSSYSYQVVSEDFKGGLTAASLPGSFQAGSPLGLNSVQIATNGCVIQSGLMTVTTQAAHNFQAGCQVFVRASGSPQITGAYTIHTTPTPTSFTVYQNVQPAGMYAPTGGMAEVVAKNLVRWNTQAYGPIRSFIYRSTNQGPYVLVGVTQGMDGSFVDWGFGLSASIRLQSYVPTTPPLTPTNQWLATTVVSGGGSTSLTLAAPASNTVMSARALHDNSPNVLNWLASTSGTLLFPKGMNAVFNSTLDLRSVGQGTVWSKLLFQAPPTFNETLVPRGNLVVDTLPGSTNNVGFPSYPEWTTTFTGKAYPLVLICPNASSVTFGHIYFEVYGEYQSGVVQDQDTGGNNCVSITYNNCYFGHGSNTGFPFVMKGGFGFLFDRGGFATNGAGINVPPSLLMTPNLGLGNSGQQLPGIVYFDKTAFAGSGIVMDSGQTPSVTNGSHMRFRETLYEGGATPLFRVAGGTNIVGSIMFENPSYADFVQGAEATPVFDLTDQRVQDFSTMYGHGAQSNGNQILVAGNLSSIDFGIFTTWSQTTSPIGINLNGSSMTATNGSIIGYQMQVPLAPTLTAVSGGSLPAGTYYYRTIPIDGFGNYGSLSPVSAGITVDGTQSIQVSWILVQGQVSTSLCRGLSLNNILQGAGGPVARHLSGTSFVDNMPQFAYTNSLPTKINGISSGFGPPQD